MVSGLGHVRRRENALAYVRGLIEHQSHASLRPTLYESLQQFIADSPWDPALLVRACAERVAPRLAVYAWVVDDIGIPKDGTHSPGVKRQYSPDLGKIRNCQLTVSLHAVGERGALPLGWALYLPEEWCDDPRRRRKTKIPDEIAFRTKPALARALCEEAAGWDVPRAPVLAGAAHGDEIGFRAGLDDSGLEYVAAVSPRTPVFAAGRVLAVEEQRIGTGSPPGVDRPEPGPEPIRSLAARLPFHAWHAFPFRSAQTGRPATTRFAIVRVTAARPAGTPGLTPHREWLIMEWPYGRSAPTRYWLSNLSPDVSADRLAGLAHLGGNVEIDYRELKGELGLDHYEGRSYRGFHHHCALVTCAHAFLTSERTDLDP
ncbi:MAG: IS701 family transposase [Gaiellaceae bacterium]